MTTPNQITGFTERILEEFENLFIHKTYPFLGGQRNYIKGLKDKNDEMYILGEFEDFIKSIPTRLIQELLEKMPEKAIRDDKPLPNNANSTEIYNKEAHNNMTDGFNLALSEVRQILNSFLNE